MIKTLLLTALFALIPNNSLGAVFPTDEAALGVEKNFNVNSGCERGTAGYSAFNTTFTDGVPTTISAGSTKLSMTSVTTNVLSGNASCQMNVTTSSGSGGHGIITDAITVSDAALAQNLAVMFDYNFVENPGNVDVSGTSTQTVEVWVYNVGLAAWYQPAGFRSMSTKGTDSQLVPAKTPAITFQSDVSNASSKNQYRIALIIRNAPAGTFKLNFDNLTFGKQSKAYGPPVTNWQDYTMTITGSSSNPSLGTTSLNKASWRRVGDSMEIHYSLMQSGAGSAGSGTYYYSLPPGYTIDTDKFNSASGEMASSSGDVAFEGTAFFTGNIFPEPTTNNKFYIRLINETTSGYQGSGFQPFSGTTIRLGMNIKVPILGWSSSAQVNDGDLTRIVAARYKSSAAQSIADSAAAAIIDFGTKEFDTHNAVTTGASWKFTAPVSGTYQVASRVLFTNSNQWAVGEIGNLTLYKNGTLYSYLAQILPQATFTNYADLVGSDKIYLNAGDYIDVRIDQTSGSSLALINNAGSVYVDIARISGPATIAVNESVQAKYTNSAGTSIGVSEQDAVFATRVYDSHGAFDGTTFTCPISGKYMVHAFMTIANENLSTSDEFSLVLYKNGSQVSNIAQLYGNGTQQYYRIGGDDDVSCLAGETLKVRITVNGGATLYNSAAHNYISIKKVGNY